MRAFPSAAVTRTRLQAATGQAISHAALTRASAVGRSSTGAMLYQPYSYSST
jgi:hypothetical protein